ncbi:hypothetical protein HDV57DRAFT_521965 [Trichoderma longibrachiatum]
MTRQFRDTDPSSELRRRIVWYRLWEQLEEHRPLQKQMKALSPAVCQPYLTGRPYLVQKPAAHVEMMFEVARGTLDIPRIHMPAQEVEPPRPPLCVALHLPESQLQMVKYNRAVAEARQYTDLTERDRFLVSCPSPLETFRIEREFSDYETAARMLKEGMKKNKHFHSSRGELRTNLAQQHLSPAQRRRGLLKSQGRPSKLREVISIDEDWPQ